MPAEGGAGPALPPAAAHTLPAGIASAWAGGGGSGRSAAASSPCGWAAWRCVRTERPGDSSSSSSIRRRPALPQEREAPWPPPPCTGRTGPGVRPVGSAGEDSRTRSEGRNKAETPSPAPCLLSRASPQPQPLAGVCPLCRSPSRLFVWLRTHGSLSWECGPCLWNLGS